MEEWFKNHLAEYAFDIANYGADSGFPHITYTHSLVKIFDEYESDIWEMLNNSADEMGYKNPIEFVSTFNRIDMCSSIDGFKSLLVWFACEELARNYDDEYQEDEDKKEEE